MTNKEKTKIGEFERSFALIEQLALELQNNEISIDELVPRMKEALEAIKICKSVLKKTEAQLIELEAEFTQLGENNE